MVHPTSISSLNWRKNDLIQSTLKRNLRIDQGATQLYYVGEMCRSTFRLPALVHVSEDMQVAMARFLIDGEIQRHLEGSRLLNWCVQTVKLTAVHTTGDGNCLLHAVATYMWGVQDSECILRQQVYNSIWLDPNGVLRARWERQGRKRNASYPGGGLQYSLEDWEREWQLMVTMATPEPRNPVNGQHSYRSLEEFHVFTLANVLRRPIIIIADPVYRNLEGHSLAPVHFGGIYLPLLWRPQHCVRHPIVLAFHNQHFTPLVAEEVVPAPNGPASSQSAPPVQQQAIPLTGRDLRLLQVQYLMPREENRVEELLHQYLHIVEVPLGDDGHVPAAMIDGPSVPAELNFIPDLLQYDWSGQRASARDSGAPEAEATGSQCSQGAEGLSVSGQHQDQSLLVNKLQQVRLANPPPDLPLNPPTDIPPNPPPDISLNPPLDDPVNPRPGPSLNPPILPPDAVVAVVPTQAPGGTVESQGSVSQQQNHVNGPPSARPPSENKPSYAAAVRTNLKASQTTTPKRRPSFPVVDKKSQKKEMRCLTDGCPNKPIPSRGRLCKQCNSQKRQQSRNRNPSSAPATRRKERPPSAAGGRSMSAPAKSPSMTRKMPPMEVGGSTNPKNQNGTDTARSAYPANSSSLRLDVPSSYSNAVNRVSPSTIQEQRVVASDIVPQSQRQKAATTTKDLIGDNVANSSRCRRDGCDGLALDKMGGLCYQCYSEEQARVGNSRTHRLPTTNGETSQRAAGAKCAIPSCPNIVRQGSVCDDCIRIVQSAQTTDKGHSAGPSHAVSTRESYADVLRGAAGPPVSSALPTTPARQTQPIMQPPQQKNPAQPHGTQQCVYKWCHKDAQEQYGFLCQQHHQKFYEDKARYSRANSEQSSVDGTGENLSSQPNPGSSTSTPNGLPTINNYINAPVIVNFLDQPGNSVARMIQQLSDAQQIANSSGCQTPPANGSRCASQASNHSQSTQNSPNGVGQSSPGASPPQEGQPCVCGIRPGIPECRNLCRTCYDRCRQSCSS